MPRSDAPSTLRDIPIDHIERNSQNPRIIFRQEEMDELTESIRVYGVLVPITVYKHKSRYVLIDGERRWLSCIKLNKKTIPALIQEPPSKLNNLLLMFNIHALREQWDLLTIALKLPTVIELLTKELNRSPNEADLASTTGLTRSVIRRAQLLMNLPSQYKEKLLAELHKPPSKQKLTEDFFIEMERALKTVQRALPSTVPDINKARDVLIEKYTGDTIGSIIDLRLIPKIARAERVGVEESSAAAALRKLFQKNKYSVEDAYNDTVSDAYSEKVILDRIDALLDKLDQFDPEEVDDDLRGRLRALIEKASRLLGGDK
jgi:ParB family chromosome partitioning protein